MIRTAKEKALHRIVWGFLVQFVPLMILGLFAEQIKALNWQISVFISLAVLLLFVAGFAAFINGCCLYSKSKGYSSKLGWIGLSSFIGLTALLFLPNIDNSDFLKSLKNENLQENPFALINIQELLLYLLVGAPTLLFLPIMIFCQFNISYSFSVLSNNPLSIFIFEILSGFIVFTKSRNTGLDFSKILGFKNAINLRLVLLIAILDSAFSYGFSDLNLYGLSFIFPNYVEEYLNDKPFSNINEIIPYAISAVILAPLFEEFFFRGLALHKWGLKWGIRKGILTSSLLFALIHFRFDVISLFVAGILFAAIYFKTHNLLSSILFHGFYNFIVLGFSVINFLGKSESERNMPIILQNYQTSAQSNLWYPIFLVAISAPLIFYFIYKNFPRNESILPYFANADKSIETN